MNVISIEKIRQYMTDGIDHLVNELGFSYRVNYVGQALSNSGSDSSTMLLGRRQMLANGRETNALSGNIFKHYHARQLYEHVIGNGLPLCPACERLNSMRVSALSKTPMRKSWSSMSQILNGCVICDTHGFLVTSKKKTNEDDAREGADKHSLIEFGMFLALPETFGETVQVKTRNDRGVESNQMMYRQATRSATYAGVTRYKARGIGADTTYWQLHIDDPDQRRARHRAILEALRDQLLSPGGAQTATLLPHLSEIEGVIGLQTVAGRAPMYSPLSDDFVSHVIGQARGNRYAIPFKNSIELDEIFDYLIQFTHPVVPTRDGGDHA